MQLRSLIANTYVRSYLWFAMAVAGGMSLIATLKGPGLSPDSVTYLSSGLNLAHNGHLRTLSGGSLTVFPPGLPLLAALSELLGVGAQTGIRLLGACCAALLVLSTHRMMRILNVRPAILRASTVLVGVSPAVLRISKFAWSEVPFMLIITLLAQRLISVRRQKQLTLADGAALCIACWGAFLLRYIGLALIAAVAISLALSLRPRRPRAIGRVAVVVGMSGVVPAAWMIRNHSADGTWMGPRSRSDQSLSTVARQTLHTIGEWARPTPELSGWVLTALGAFVVLVGAWLIGRAIRVTPRAADSSMRAQAPADLQPLLVLVAVYVVYLWAAQLRTAIDPINLRLLAPVYVPMVVVGSCTLTDYVESRPRIRRPWRKSVIQATIVLFLLSQLSTSLRETRGGALAGIEYNAQKWQSSELSAATLKEAHGRDVDVYTNQVNGLWAGTELLTIQETPLIGNGDVASLEAELATFATAVGCSTHTSIVAIFVESGSRAAPITELERVVELRPLASVADGTLYAATAKIAATPDCSVPDESATP